MMSRTFPSRKLGRRLLGGAAVALSIAMAAVCGAEESAPSIEFARHYEDGQQFVIQMSESLNMSVQRIAHGESLGFVKGSDAAQIRGRVTIVKAENGIPTVQRIDVDRGSGEFFQMAGETPHQTHDQLAGKTVTVAHHDDGYAVTDLNGGEDLTLSRAMGNWLARDESLYPNGPVQVGDKWDLSDKAGRLTVLSADQQVSAFAQLKAVRTVKGKRFAELTVSCAYVGTMRQATSVRMEIQMEGPAWIELSSGRLARMDLSGDVHARGMVTGPVAGGGTAPLAADGTGTFEYHALCAPARPRQETAAAAAPAPPAAAPGSARRSVTVSHGG